MSKIYESLEDFQKKVALNLNVQKLVRNWTPNIIIEATDTGSVFTLLIRDCLIEKIITGGESSGHDISVEGNEDMLCSIFTGVVNPAEAVLNGELVVFGDANDQIKLDAITLLIWGM